MLSDVARICKRLAKNAKELVHSAHGSLIEFQDLLIISLVDLAAPHLAALRPWAELLPRQLWAACCCILDAIQLALGSLDLSSLEALGRNNQLLLSLAAAVTAGLVCVLVVLRVGKAFRAPPTEEGADAQHDQGVSAPDTPPAVGHPLISRTPNEVFSDTHVAPQAEASPTSTYLKSQEATPIATGMMQSSAPQVQQNLCISSITCA